MELPFPEEPERYGRQPASPEPGPLSGLERETVANVPTSRTLTGRAEGRVAGHRRAEGVMPSIRDDVCPDRKN